MGFVQFMTPGFAAALLFTAGIVAPAFAEDAANDVPLPQAAVNALNRLAGGVHPGFRANHAKGVLLTGHFVPSKDAASVSKAGHLKVTGKPVPILVRFSDTTGVPNLPDADPNASPHGMAIRFTLPDQSTTDIVSISARSFPVAKPEEFVELLNAIADSGPGAAKPSPIEKFMGAHPVAAAWAGTPRPAPISFATLAFYGVNAFKFTNSAGTTRYGRYQILPVAGEHALSDEAAKAQKPDYLMDEAKAHLKKHPMQFRLLVQLAEAGDPLNDGSQAWPDTRHTVELGGIVIDGVVKDQAGEQKRLMFTPLALTDGIEPSDDPILLIRPLAYAISLTQRSN